MKGFNKLEQEKAKVKIKKSGLEKQVSDDYSVKNDSVIYQTLKETGKSVLKGLGYLTSFIISPYLMPTYGRNFTKSDSDAETIRAGWSLGGSAMIIGSMVGAGIVYITAGKSDLSFPINSILLNGIIWLATNTLSGVYELFRHNYKKNKEKLEEKTDTEKHISPISYISSLGE